MSTQKVNWRDFWKQYDDPQLLNHKSDHIDETLREIEHQLHKKLLSGEQMMIIEALEDRIDELSRQSATT